MIGDGTFPYFNLPTLNTESVRLLAGFQSKHLASSVFVSERPKEDVIHKDFFPFKLFQNHYEVNEKTKETTVEMSVFGHDATQTSLYRTGLGCTLVGRMGVDSLRMQGDIQPYTKIIHENSYWPYGEKVYEKPVEGLNREKLEKLIHKLCFHFGRKGILIVYDGKLVEEKYASSFDKKTKIQGWSMTKSLGNTLLGLLEKEGKLSFDDKTGIKAWEDDARKDITIKDLGRMVRRLEWDESYLKASDVTRMLYEKEDMPAFAINKPLKAPIGQTFNYSSGSAMILSKVIRDKFKSTKEYWEFLQKTLCKDLNIKLVLEPDAKGNLVIASDAWMNLRDWTKLALLYSNNGFYNGKQILSSDWVKKSLEPTNRSTDQDYGFLLDLNYSQKTYTNAPKDMFFLAGVAGQRVYVIPSKKLIVSQSATILDDFADIEMNWFLGKILDCVE